MRLKPLAPGKNIRLTDASARCAQGRAAEARSREGGRALGRSDRRAAGRAVRRRSARAPGRVAGTGHVGQGWDDPQGVRAARSARHHGHELQGADASRSSRTTSSGGCTRRCRCKGTIGVFNRSHYEDVLVVRVHELVPEVGLASALRADQPVRAHARRKRCDDPQVLPAHLARGAARAAAGPAGRPAEVLEVFGRGSAPSATDGMPIRRPTRRRWSGPARPAAPW